VGRNYAVAPWAAFLYYTNVPTPVRSLMVADRILPELASNVYTTPGDIRMPEPGFKNAYNQQWNLTVQQSLPGNMALEIGYVGSRAVHLDFELWGRRYASLYGLQDFFLGPSLRLSASGFDSRYNALQTTLEKRFSRGLSFRLNYTFANLMNNTPELFDVDTSSHFVIDHSKEWARSQADLRHNLNFSGIYELPFGRRRPWGANWHRVLDGILGGWKLNYILEANSGAPINVLWGPIFRPDLVPGRSPFVSDPNPSRWFDVSAFKVQGCTAPCQGNTGRNLLDGPNFFNVDLGISKIFFITETHKLDARLELFNATNHPNLFRGGQQVDVSLPGAGALLSAYPMRRVQVAVRYSF
jgi:hypothetical protein